MNMTGFLGDVLQTVLATIFSVIVMFLLTKLMGNRQIGQLSAYDYIIGITIGSIAAETSLSADWGEHICAIIAMVVYAGATIFISFATCKNIKMRRLFEGAPIVLYEDGKLYTNNLLKARVDINEFLTQCRIGGYFNLQQLQAVVLETSGNFSFLPKSTQRPITPQDMQLQMDAEKPLFSLIIDGKVMQDNLKASGKDDVWLQRQLEKQHYKVNEVFLAMCDWQNNLDIYGYADGDENRSEFQ
ncbi:MAG: DUF421 domain-containing protein [Oscillospiraceae bacterium]|nr:DUF421 domain-containing protein [Oscillospiraceae bacterium]